MASPFSGLFANNRISDNVRCEADSSAGVGTSYVYASQ